MSGTGAKPGRPRRAGPPAGKIEVRVSEAERAELTDGLDTASGETLSDLLRTGGLALVRARHSKET